MRIGIDYTSAINQRAGIGRFTRGLVKALAELDCPHSFVLLQAKSPLAEQNDAWPANFSVKTLPFAERTLNILWHRLQLPLSIQTFAGALDLFHAPDFTLPPFKQGRGIVTIHDLSFMLFPQQAEPNLVRYLNNVVPRSIARAKAVLADSLSTKNDLVRLLGVPAEKICVVHGGVDSRFKPVMDVDSRAAVLQRFDISTPFILTVGTLQPRKNLLRLLEAFISLKKTNAIEHKLVIVGAKGWLYDSFFQRLKDDGLAESVITPGFIPDDDLPALLSAATVFVFPSLYEGFGLPPLEAMACGVPVVCSGVSSLPEVMGNAGLLFDPENVNEMAAAILRMLNDQELRRESIATGLKQAATFDWHKTAERTLAVYEAVGRGLSLEAV